MSGRRALSGRTIRYTARGAARGALVARAQIEEGLPLGLAGVLVKQPGLQLLEPGGIVQHTHCACACMNRWVHMCMCMHMCMCTHSTHKTACACMCMHAPGGKCVKHGSTSSAVHVRAYTRRVAVPGESGTRRRKRPTDFCNLAGEHGGRAEGLLVEARVRELLHVVYVLRARHGEGGLQREQHPGEVVAASSPASSSTPRCRRWRCCRWSRPRPTARARRQKASQAPMGCMPPPPPPPPPRPR